MIISLSVLKSSNRVFYVLLSQKCDFQTGFFTMSFDPTHLVSQLTDLNREDGDFRLTCDGLVVKAHSFILSLRYGAREYTYHSTLLYSPTGLNILRRPSQLAWEMQNPNQNLK